MTGPPLKRRFRHIPIPNSVRLGAAALVSLLVLVLLIGMILQNPLLKTFDLFFYDRFSTQFPSPELSGQLTIVDIDETSLSAVGQWPWPRYRLAQLIDIIAGEDPAAVGIDILFPEADRTSLKTVQNQFKRDFGLELGYTGVPASLSDNDGFLGAVLNRSQAVGARYFYFDHLSREAGCSNSPVEIIDKTDHFSPHQATGILCNMPVIENRLCYNGFMNNKHDPDGILRRTPLVIEWKGKLFPHLSFATFLKSKGINRAEVLENLFGFYIQAGKFQIPVTDAGYFNIRFHGPARRHRYISGVDILNGRYAASDIKGKTVFVGSSAVGLNDIHHTIFDSQFPGIEVHAVILENIIQQQFIVTPVWSQGVINVLTVFSGLLMILFFYINKPSILLIGTIAWVALLLISSLVSFRSLSLFISPTLPVLLSVFLFSLLSLTRFALEKKASFNWYQKMVDSQQLTLRAMVSMVETRDPETGEHIKRTQQYARVTAECLQNKGLYADELTDDFIVTLFLAVPLHDIGKVGIPDAVLLKPDRLTDDEYEIMKTHAAHGENIIERTSEEYELDYYLQMSAEIAGSHHERWDGKGYPRGLSGYGIPLSGRIMAIADVYDALISRRVYKPPFSHQKAIGIILEERGKLFDPTIVDAFLAVEDKIKDIAARYGDGETALDA